MYVSIVVPQHKIKIRRLSLFHNHKIKIRNFRKNSETCIVDGFVTMFDRLIDVCAWMNSDNNGQSKGHTTYNSIYEKGNRLFTISYLLLFVYFYSLMLIVWSSVPWWLMSLVRIMCWKHKVTDIHQNNMRYEIVNTDQSLFPFSIVRVVCVFWFFDVDSMIGRALRKQWTYIK